KTTCCRPWASRHLLQPATESAKTASSCIARESSSVGGVSAAPAGAAAASSAAKCRSTLDAVRREDRELLADILGAAVRAIGLLAHRHELLVVGLAFHADELVDRHAAAILAGHSKE